VTVCHDIHGRDVSFKPATSCSSCTPLPSRLVFPPQVMPYSTACSTTLSNFEAGQNYKDVDDPAVTVRRSAP